RCATHDRRGISSSPRRCLVHGQVSEKCKTIDGNYCLKKPGVKSGQSISSHTETEESPLLVVMQQRALVLQSMGPHHDVWEPVVHSARAVLVLVGPILRRVARRVDTMVAGV